MLFKLVLVLLAAGISANPITECPIALCAAKIQPVCSSDGKLYYSNCDFLNHNCDNGVTEVDWSQCTVACDKQACPLNYSPQCGDDGNIYGNRCAFLWASCGKPHPIVSDSMTNCVNKKCPDNCASDDEACKESVNQCRRPYESWGN